MHLRHEMDKVELKSCNTYAGSHQKVAQTKLDFVPFQLGTHSIRKLSKHTTGHYYQITVSG
ncbi:MAG: hypothetical protein NVS2B7_37700 [Herpetosiphon sp.]